MNGPRLPVEVIEEIIDSCVSHAAVPNHEQVLRAYQVLCTCSLICRDLLPRSRKNLYSVVMFRCSEQVDKLLATLTSNPSLGELVRALRVDPSQDKTSGGKYIPFARSELVSKVPNVQTLVVKVDWSLYPPWYHRLASLYPITELFLWS